MRATPSIEIDVEATRAFEFIANPENNPSWQSGMKHCAWTSPPPVGLGSVYEQRAEFMGKEILTTFEVTAYEPGSSITIQSVISTFPIQVTRSVQPLADTRCRVSAVITGQPPWYMRLMPFMGTMMQRSIDADYRALKALLESTR